MLYSRRWQTRATGQISPPPVVNKVLLECRHIHTFTIVCSCFCATTAELRSCGKDHVTSTPKIFTVWPSTEKFANPWLIGYALEEASSSCRISASSWGSSRLIEVFLMKTISPYGSGDASFASYRDWSGPCVFWTGPQVCLCFRWTRSSFPLKIRCYV